MRKRNIVIGMLLGAVGAASLASSASAAVTGQTYKVTTTPTRLDTKLFKGVSFRNDVDTTYVGATPAAQFTPGATNTTITYDANRKFVPGNTPQCSAASIAGQTSAAVQTGPCAASIVGQGASTVRTQTGATLLGTVTALNGTKSGANSVILLHVDLGPLVPTKPILTGTLTGNVLSVAIPPVAGTVITHFDTTINNKKTSKGKAGASAAKKKKKKAATFYVMARCKTGTWVDRETTTFTDGTTQSATSTEACQKIKPKKK